MTDAADYPWCMLGGSHGTVPLGYACVFEAGHAGACAPRAPGVRCSVCGSDRLILGPGMVTVCPSCDYSRT